MPSFLVTPKMNPALAARVLGSVRGNPQSGTRPGLRNLWRATLVVFVLGTAAILIAAIQNEKEQLQSAKQRLIGRVETEMKNHEPGAAQLLVHAEKALLLDSQHPPPAPIALEPARLAQLMQQPSVYIRGSRGDFREPSGVARAAAETRRDALLSCLLAAPERDAMVSQIRDVYSGRFFAKPAFTHVSLLHQLTVSAAYASPHFLTRIESARHPEEVKDLERVFERANLPKVREATRAGLLIYAMDEEKQPGTLSSIDGASDHFVRIGLVELGQGEVLFRVRVRADPAQFEKKSEQRYLAGLTDCAAAIEARSR